LFGHVHRQAAQRVIAAELDDDDLRLMLLEQAWQAGTPARGGVATDAGIDHRG